MILEALVTTINADGSANLAPMGPEVDPDLGMDRFVLRPFCTSTTYRNLKERGEGVLHVTDDARMLALAAIGRDPGAEMRPAHAVRGFVLAGACRYYEFRVAAIDDREGRATISAETVASGRLRDFFGWNRGKHAVVEAAVLATRVEFLAMGTIVDEYRKLAVLVEKTGGPDERSAFGALADFVRDAALARGLEGPDPFLP